MPWMDDWGLFVIAGLLVGFIALIIGDRVKLPGGLEIFARHETRIALGVLGLGLFVWGCVLVVG